MGLEDSGYKSSGGWEGARGLTAFDAKLDPAVHIVGPDVLWRLTVEHREDSSAQVGLAGGLSRAGDGNDRCPRSVPRQKLG